MSANTLSFKAAWANIRALPGGVMKPVWAALLTLCAVYTAAAMQDTSQLQANPQATATVWLSLIVLLLLCFATGYAVNRMIAAHDRGEPLSLSFLMKGFLRRFLLPLIVLYILLGVAVGIVMLPMVLMWLYWASPATVMVYPALVFVFYLVLIYICLRITCATSVVAFEDVPFFNALNRSWRMTSGRFWAILWVWLATALVAAVAAFLWTVLLMLFGMLSPPDVTEPEPTALGYIFVFGYAVLTMIPAALLPIAIYRVLRDSEAAEAAEA